MKFGKKLRELVDKCEEEWRPQFINYKSLKKCINPAKYSSTQPDDAKNLNAANAESDISETGHSETQPIPKTNSQQAEELSERLANNEPNLAAVRQAEIHLPNFFSSFRKEVDKVNDFYLDKEEDYIIEHRQLSERVEQCVQPGNATRPEVSRLQHRLTDFLQELDRLENFSTVNYTGFRKILKKHDKKTGRRVHQIYLGTVLMTPFYIRDTVRKLITSTELLLQRLQAIRKFRRDEKETVSCTQVVFTLTPKRLSTIQPRITGIQVQTQQQETSPSTPELTTSTDDTRALRKGQEYSEISGQYCYYKPNSYPRPHAFISQQSSLWRIFRDARMYGAAVRSVITKNSLQDILPSPPQRLLDDIDALFPTELGIFESFLNKVKRPCNYSIASEQDFSVGFFVLEKGTQLQLFRKDISEGVCITRNMHGNAIMRCYETVSNDMKDGLFVREKRNGQTTGPWPCVKCVAGKMHVVWEAQTKCAIVYVWTPSLMEDYLPKFEIKPVDKGTNHEEKSGLLKVNCIAGSVQYFGRCLC